MAKIINGFNATYGLRIYSPCGELIRDENDNYYDLLKDAIGDKECWIEEGYEVELVTL